MNASTAPNAIHDTAQFKSASSTPQEPSTPHSDENESAISATGWIAKRDRHMQLINTSVYDQKTLSRAKAMEETRRLRAQQRDEREKAKINKHFQRNQAHATNTTPSSAAIDHTVTINGLLFRVTNGGSRLARISGKHLFCVLYRTSFQRIT